MEKIQTIEEFAKLVRERRKSMHLTQSELAGLCGITTEGLSKIERGDAEPKLGTVIKLVKLLNGNVEMIWR